MMRNICIDEGEQSIETGIDLDGLRELLGHDVLLLHCALGSKKPVGKWGDLTIEAMNDPRHLARLTTGNIGAALGAVSGGLCVIDLDRDELVTPFVEANAHLNLERTFRTRGSRGAAIWVRCIDAYPGTTTLKTITGKPAGEFRADGAMQIAAGIHPTTQRPYELLVARSPVAAAFSAVIWPREFQPPLKKPTTNINDFRISDSLIPSDSLSIAPKHFFSPVSSLEEVLRRTVPSDSHQNNHLLFLMARGIKSLEMNRGKKFTPDELLHAFDQWHSRAQQYLRKGQDKETYLAEFLSAYGQARFPLGSKIVEQAFELAQREPLPVEAMKVESSKWRLLIGLCFQLQRLSGAQPFFLGSRTAAALLQQPQRTVSQWLRCLCVLQVLEEVVKGDTRRASRYRYISNSQELTKQHYDAGNL